MDTGHKGRTVSIIVPALNEERNLADAVATVVNAIGDAFADYELLVFNDGSTDGTGKVADELAAVDPHLRVTHNSENKGFGYNYRRGIEIARMEYVTWFPGDNDAPGEGLRAILAAVGSADIVVGYLSNSHVRSPGRRFISVAYVTLLNALFGLRLRYYNGPSVIPRRLLLTVPINTRGFACLAATLIRLLRSGYGYVEVPYQTGVRQHGRTKAFMVKNIVSVLGTIAGLFWEVRIRDRHKYPGAAPRIEARV